MAWPEGEKKPKAHHLEDKKSSKALGGAFWGLLFGLIFGVPFFGIALGAGFGLLSDESPDKGLSKFFIDEIGSKVTEGTSALFLKTSNAELDKVTKAVKAQGWKYEIISTNLTEGHEQQLREEFGIE